MADISFSLPEAESINITGRAADKLIRRGDGDAALLYLYILRNPSGKSLHDAAEALGRTEDEVKDSLRILASLGLMNYTEDGSTPPPRPERPDELPQYSINDIRLEMQNGSVFKNLVDAVQDKLGKILNSDGLMKLFGIYDSLGLPPEVIVLLVSHCIAETRRKTGEPGRVPTMRYIEKAAYDWERRGIFSLDDAERYLRELEERRSAFNQVCRRLGITGRAVAPSERQYINTWLGLGFMPDAIAIAYDRTVSRTGKFSLKYMDSIINNWHSKGLFTVDDIMEKDSPRRQTRQAGTAPKPSDAQESASAAELASMRRLLDRMREE